MTNLNLIMSRNLPKVRRKPIKSEKKLIGNESKLIRSEKKTYQK
jgi:hypothetical protein